MLLFSPLYDSLIRVFLESGKLSIQDLHRQINKEYPISLPNIYKIVAKLLDDQIFVKEWKKIFLHKRWVLDFCEMANKMQEKLQQFLPISNVDIEEWKIVTYKANSIKDIDGIWADVFLMIQKSHQNPEPMYIYHSHPYYALGMKETEMSFFLQAQNISHDVYLLFSDTCFLDKYWSDLYKQAWMRNVTISDKHAFLKDWYCIAIVWDYLFEFLYPQSISEYFKVFFESVHNIKQFNEELFKRIFEMKWNCKITLRCSSKDANQFKKQILKFF